MPQQNFRRPALELLVQYARCHRDRRNITLHLVGVPMTLLGASLVLSLVPLPLGPFGSLGGRETTLAWLAFGLLALWTLSRGAALLGLTATCFTAAWVWAGHGFGAAMPTTALACSVGSSLFVLGWLVQIVGHYYEGRGPALADDPAVFFAGPLFVTMECLALAGWSHPLAERVERAAGPTMLRDLAQPLAR